MKVIIPLAGEGKRMRPHTHSKPKPLINIAGKSSLKHILDELESHDKKGDIKISEIIFITGHLAQKIEDYVKKHYDFKTRFIEQKVRDGTAGAVRLAEKYIDEPVLIIFVDTIFEADLSIINKLKDDESGIIWAQEVEDYQRFGVMVMGKDGYMIEMVEKPDKPVSKLANIGMYFMKDYKLMYEGIKYIYDNDIRPKGEFYLTDAFGYMIKKGAKIICPTVKGWYDTGKPETFLESHKELLKKGRHKEIKTENSKIIPPVHIADDVTIKGSTVGPHVTIAKGTEIINSIVKESVIGENTKITDANLDDSIIGEECQVTGAFKHLNIGDHCVVKGAGKKNK
ncbi:NTP transferase domain-containing protein [Candidatus Woesearchaeota archaeon]|nr:NTP transferase domain-containing protein [Candidatus Woesearchaeota archaeon]